MLKVTVLYGPPTDPSAFEDHYTGKHLPLAADMPNVKRFEASKVVGTPDGTDAPYYRIAEIWYESEQDMQASLGSEAGQATVADIGTFATGGATVVISAVE